MDFLNGRFELEHNQNLFEYLTALGVPEQKARIADSVRPIMEIRIEDKEVFFSSNSGLANASSKVLIGEEIDEHMPMGITLKSSAKLDGNKLIVTSVTQEGIQGLRVYEFVDGKLLVTISSGRAQVPTAIRTYKRI